MKKIITSIILIVVFIFCAFILLFNYYLLKYNVNYALEDFSIKKFSINLKNVSVVYNGTFIKCEKFFLKIKTLFPLSITSKIKYFDIKNEYINAVSKENTFEYNYEKNIANAYSSSFYIKNYKLDLQKLNITFRNNILNGKFFVPNKIHMSKNFIIKSLTSVKFNNYIFFNINIANSSIIELKTTNIDTNFFTARSLCSTLKILDKSKNIIDISCSLDRNSNIKIHGIISSFSPLNGEINCTLQNANIIDLSLKKLSNKNKLLNFIFNITGLQNDNNVKNYDIKIKNGVAEIYD